MSRVLSQYLRRQLVGEQSLKPIVQSYYSGLGAEQAGSVLTGLHKPESAQAHGRQDSELAVSQQRRAQDSEPTFSSPTSTESPVSQPPNIGQDSPPPTASSQVQPRLSDPLRPPASKTMSRESSVSSSTGIQQDIPGESKTVVSSAPRTSSANHPDPGDSQRSPKYQASFPASAKAKESAIVEPSKPSPSQPPQRDQKEKRPPEARMDRRNPRSFDEARFSDKAGSLDEKSNKASDSTSAQRSEHDISAVLNPPIHSTEQKSNDSAPSASSNNAHSHARRDFTQQVAAAILSGDSGPERPYAELPSKQEAGSDNLEVSVTIGHVSVMPSQTEPSPKKASWKPPISLSDYLRERKEGKR
ncbi:hypothetical protein [Veronia pacifica]|uniref:Uncharacterized protein n=1 Tax=Veronia pacifica TaxID=1080227 RepID=A0A1C3EEC3_9GAMM|nr:hypothetical protein [Veronia pacifica]ODA31588.1 hypothetical protein A8L45_16415 [Veronia pacifica]